MLNCKKLKMILGMGAILVPTVVFGKTSATVSVDVMEIMENPGELEEIVAQMNKGETVEVLEVVQSKEDETVWYEIALEDENTAFARPEHLIITDAHGAANVDSLNIRSYPDANNSEVIGQLKTGDEVRLLYKVGKFYKVYVNDMSGFVYAEYIDTTYGEWLQQQDIESVKDIVTGESKAEPEAVETTSLGDEVVTKAMNYLGNPYVYGGTSLTKGTDCSGFTQGVMKLIGVSIPRTSRSQSQFGTLVSKSQLQKGDLLFFGSSSSAISHVGMYIGNGQMIHASTPSTGIIISDAFRSGGTPLQVIRRVL